MLLYLSATVLISTCAGSVSKPSIRLFQVDEEDRRVVKLVSSEGDSEQILENVRAARLECMAAYPVQWIYSGNGVQ